jgi:benzoyl-CoA reductase/2-hydroxyglutaryl-CoA dehydratase subunit BcrC/BadD/HgdB
MPMSPLFQDEFAGAPLKRALAYLLAKREKGVPIVGNYCAYAPIELVHAMGGRSGRALRLFECHHP